MQIDIRNFFPEDEIYVKLKNYEYVLELIKIYNKELSKTFVTGVKTKRGIKLTHLKLLLKEPSKIEEIVTHIKITRYGKFLESPLKFQLDSSWFYISELIRTDGHISKNFDRVKLTNNDKSLLIKFENFCNSLGIKYIDKDSDRYTAYNSTLAKILNKIFEIQNGNKSLIVYLPELIKNLDNNLLSCALRGAFDGDGTVQNDMRNGTRRVRLTTGSRRYADDIQECLMKFGIKSSVFKDPRHYRNVWYVEISDKVSLTKFQQEIGFSQLTRSKKLNELLKTYSNYPLEEFRAILEDLLWVNNKMTITQIAKVVNRSLSTVSDQIIKLENCGAIKTERVGNKKFVSLI